jgi:hypothetical protein
MDITKKIPTAKKKNSVNLHNPESLVQVLNLPIYRVFQKELYNFESL